MGVGTRSTTGLAGEGLGENGQEEREQEHEKGELFLKIHVAAEGVVREGFSRVDGWFIFGSHGSIRLVNRPTHNSGAFPIVGNARHEGGGPSVSVYP